MQGKNRGRLSVVFVRVILIGIVIFLIHLISAFTFDKSIEYKEITFRSKKITSNINGYRIAFVSDFHDMTPQEIKDVATAINMRKLDLLIFGGDFTYPQKGTPFQRSMEALTSVVAADGIYAVDGNHDSLVALVDAMGKYSFRAIRSLSNRGVRVQEGFHLAGVVDIRHRKPDIAKAIERAQPDDFILLVVHNPDVTMQQDTAGIDLILSAHTHGGHATFFGLWAPALTLSKKITQYGQHFMSGWSKSRDGVPVYVSNGTGYYSAVPRVFARPQVILLTLVAE
jgi:predicted MPP superfamily phosphohydrolase